MKISKNKKAYIVATIFGLSLIVIDGSTFILHSKASQAATAFTVNTDANTIFKKDGVTDTADGVATGQHVVVRGLIATSTNTILAKSVNIITHDGTKNGLKHVFNKQK